MKTLLLLLLVTPFNVQAQADTATIRQLLLKVEAQQNTMIDLFHMLDENIATTSQLRRRIRNLETRLTPLRKLNGKLFSKGGTVGNNSYTNLYDGDLSTYWHAQAAAGAYVGFEFDTARVVREFRYAPRKNKGSDKNVHHAVRGLMLQGSNESDHDGFVDLYQIATDSFQEDDAKALVGVLLDNEIAYKWVRVLFPENSFGFASEIELWGY